MISYYNKSRKLIKLIIISLFVLMLASTVSAQSTGKLVGKVTEESSGTSLAGANVILLGTSLGVRQIYKVIILSQEFPLETYQIKASFLGYEDTPFVSNNSCKQNNRSKFCIERQ